MRTILLTGLAVAAGFVFGCAPAAGTMQPAWSPGAPYQSGANLPEGTNRVFDRCALTASVNPQERSFAAMIISLQEENWTTQTIDAERSTLYAEICYRDDNRYCAAVAFRVGEQGGVTATPDYVQPKVADDLERWFVALERSFNKYRCYSDALLREEVRKYGIVY